MQRSHLAASALFASCALAHPPFEPLGVVPGYSSTVAWAGDTVQPWIVGECRGGPPEMPARAFLWINGQGIQPVAANAGVTPVVARASASTLIVGQGADGSGFTWSNGPVLLPVPEPGTTVEPMAVAAVAGGTVVVGAMHLPGGRDLAFRWSAGTGYTTVPALPTGETYGTALGMNVTGNVVVGRLARFGESTGQAFIWTPAGTVGLGWLSSAGIPDSTATSTDGITTVGYSTGGSLPVSAFRYSDTTGMVELPALPGTIEARALSISYFTHQIVGYCTYPDGHTAPILWDPWLGTLDLRDVVASSRGIVPSGWSLDRAVSFNAGTIVGNGHDASGNQVAFVIRPRLCFANCDQSTSSPLLSVSDFACFLNRFGAGEDYANCDHSTTPPILNVLDFMCFIDKYVAGCSVP
jgi:hypothetical protein